MKEHSPLTIGIDFGGTSIKTAVVHRSEIIDHSPPIATQDFAGHGELISEMVRAIQDLRVRHPEVAAIGVGMPGFVNFETGLVYQLTNVNDWTAIPLKSLLEEQTGLPVAVDNDANCMAVAEWKWGAARGLEHVVFMTIGTGVGGAIIANGQMIRGAFHGAGEIGQTSIDYRGLRGHYGNFGALEDYIGNREIAIKAHQAYQAAGVPMEHQDCTPAALADAARRGDPIASAQWEDVGRLLATAAMNCCWLLNPQAIVIGGGVARAGDLLLKPLKSHLFDQLSGPFKDHLQILPATFGHEAGTIGAATLAQELVS